MLTMWQPKISRGKSDIEAGTEIVPDMGEEEEEAE